MATSGGQRLNVIGPVADVMSDDESDDELTPEELAEKSLLRGGERVSKGRQRSDRDDV